MDYQGLPPTDLHLAVRLHENAYTVLDATMASTRAKYQPTA